MYSVSVEIIILVVGIMYINDCPRSYMVSDFDVLIHTSKTRPPSSLIINVDTTSGLILVHSIKHFLINYTTQ